MTNTIAPTPNSLISLAPSYHQQSTVNITQQQHQNSTLLPPTSTVNAADKPQNTGIQLDTDAGGMQQAQLAAIKDWLKNAPLGNTKSTVYKNNQQYMVISTRPDTGELYTYVLTPGQLNPFLNNGIQA